MRRVTLAVFAVAVRHFCRHCFCCCYCCAGAALLMLWPLLWLLLSLWRWWLVSGGLCCHQRWWVGGGCTIDGWMVWVVGGQRVGPSLMIVGRSDMLLQWSGGCSYSRFRHRPARHAAKFKTSCHQKHRPNSHDHEAEPAHIDGCSVTV